MSCTRSRSVPIDDWYSYAVPEVDGTAKGCPKSRSTSGTA